MRDAEKLGDGVTREAVYQHCDNSFLRWGKLNWQRDRRHLLSEKWKADEEFLLVHFILRDVPFNPFAED